MIINALNRVDLKTKVYNLLEGIPRSTRGQKRFDAILISLILLNLLAVILGTVKQLNERYELIFFSFEVFSVAIFSFELILRFWVSDRNTDNVHESRWRFFTNPYTLADILAILPFYLGFLLSVDLRLLRLLRLFKLFRFSSYFRSLTLLWSVIKLEFRPMLSASAVVAIMMLFTAAGIYLLERESQPEHFGDLPSSLWWVVVTMTTVGYGDAVPITWLGRVLGGLIMILGIGLVALPAGMLASRFSEVMHRKQSLFRQTVEESLKNNGQISDELIEQRRQELFIGQAEANTIVSSCINESQQTLHYCPSCGKKLPKYK